MTLASQSIRARGSGRSSRSSRFKRRKKGGGGRRVLGGLLLVAILGGGGYWVITRVGGGPQLAGAGQPAETADRSAETEDQPRPHEIRMGEASQRARVQEPVTPPPASQPVERPVARQPEPEPEPVRTVEPEPKPEPKPQPAAPVTTTPPAPQGPVDLMLQRGGEAQNAGRLVEARTLYNGALFHERATPAHKEVARALLTEVNADLLFSPTVYEGDPLTEKYRVQSGDALSTIPRKQNLGVHYKFLARINGLKNENSLQLGQPLKLVRGPFHAVVDKSDFRVDVYAGDTPSPNSTGRPDGAEDGWVYIRSFSVGLGEGGGTPVGNFKIKNKEHNPSWRNPRTGDFYDRDDPRNPIGDYWLGIEGIDETSAQHTGYGLHGTIEPESIGREMSMGCVRLGDQDIATLWEMLVEERSIVRIRP